MEIHNKLINRKGVSVLCTVTLNRGNHTELCLLGVLLLSANGGNPPSLVRSALGGFSNRKGEL